MEVSIEEIDEWKEIRRKYNELKEEYNKQEVWIIYGTYYEEGNYGEEYEVKKVIEVKRTPGFSKYILPKYIRFEVEKVKLGE